MIIIPAIDLKNGQCVRLERGLMEKSTVFSDNPLEMARHWAGLGAQRLHLVDLDGAFAGKPMNADIISQISHNLPDLSIQVGGGIRDIKTASSYIDSGVDFLIIGTMAVTNPEFISELCQQFAGKIIIGLDANNGLVATDGWAQQTNIKVIDLAKKFEQDGVSCIIYTDIAKDGMMQGVNLSATRDLAISTTIPIIASGGITTIDDVANLLNVADSGIIGAITGRAIYDGSLDFAKAINLCKSGSDNDN